MIYYNLNTINDWNFGDDNIIKVYKNGAVVFYKFDSEQGGYKVCYAVVDDITQYQDTEFEDVYDKATEKWFKLNNLNEYEEYGVYGSGRNVTTYNGKLTIDDGYEYEWNGSSWANLGEVSGGTIVPQGYTEVEYIENTGTSYINTDYYPNQDTRIIAEMQVVTYNTYGRLFGAGNHNTANTISCDYVDNGNTFEVSWGGYTGWTQYSMTSNLDKRTYDWNKNNFYIDGTLLDSKTFKSFTCSYKLGIFNVLESNNQPTSNTGRYFYGRVYNFKIFNNSTLVRDFVPVKRNSDNKYGLYDVVNNVFYTSPNNANFIGGAETGTTEYPKYYSEKSEPLDNLTFNTLAEAQAYAEANCVYVGLKATIDGDKYVFSGDSQSGYEWVYKPSRLPDGYTEVEYVENTSTAYINTNIQVYSSTTNSFEVEAKLIAAKHDSQTYQNVFSCMSEDGEPYQGFSYRYQSSSLVGVSIPNGQNTFTIVNNEGSTQTVTVTSSSSQRTYTHTYPLTLLCGLNSSRNPFRWTNSKFYYCKIKMNDELVRDFVPCKRDSDSKYGMYDLISDTFYLSPNNVNFSGGDPVI